MIEHATLSEKGQKRDANQDVCRVCLDQSLYLVADGMGGSAAGGVASSLAVSTVEDFVRLATGTREFTWPFGYDSRASYEHNVLSSAVRLANSKVVQAAQQQERYAGSGSTLVLLWLKEQRAYYTHIGDSRLYLLRQSHLSRLTRDHSLVQEQLELGLITPEQVSNHGLRHIVTQAIGMQEPLRIEVSELDLEPDDRIMLCTDGLTDPMEDEALEAVLQKHTNLDSACRELAGAANQSGSSDDITVVLVRFAG